MRYKPSEDLWFRKAPKIIDFDGFMKAETIFSESLNTKISYRLFGLDGPTAEIHALLEPLNHRLSAQEQIRQLEQSLNWLFADLLPVPMQQVWKRFFLSDAANQATYIDQGGASALSIVQQPPLNGSKVAVWVYGIQNASIQKASDGTVGIHRPHYTHLFHTGIHSPEGDSYKQTLAVFSRYISSLQKQGANLEQHCIRTWLYVQNVDVQYAGLVTARKQVFDQEALTSDTHYIASTGIEGRMAHPEVAVLMDAYAVPEITAEQLTFLKGTGFMNPTHEYGVTFERGTEVSYGDRKHVFISGTASINDKGEVVHPQEVLKQAQRALDNISALLNEASCTMEDMAYLLIYLRDVADYKPVEDYMQALYPGVPKLILLAPVCRPGWLIEIEGMALRAHTDPRFEPF